MIKFETWTWWTKMLQNPHIFFIYTQFLLLLWVEIWWVPCKYGYKIGFVWSLCVQFVSQSHKGHLLGSYGPFKTHFRANKWIHLRSILINLVQYGFWPFSVSDVGKHPLFWPSLTFSDLGHLPVLTSCLG